MNGLGRYITVYGRYPDVSTNPLRIVYESSGRSQLSEFDRTQGAQPPEPPGRALLGDGLMGLFYGRPKKECLI